jgi:hypothetical protein
VRFFSGTATYRNRVAVPARLLAPDRALFLDLGRVEVIAHVLVNGRDLGITWKPPHQVDVTRAIRGGANDLEVRVTTLWPNRLIGDEELPEEYAFGTPTNVQFGSPNAIREVPAWFVEGKPRPAGKRITFTTWKHYRRGDPLLASGLLGPVRVRTALRRTLERGTSPSSADSR